MSMIALSRPERPTLLFRDSQHLVTGTVACRDRLAVDFAEAATRGWAYWEDASAVTCCDDRGEEARIGYRTDGAIVLGANAVVWRILDCTDLEAGDDGIRWVDYPQDVPAGQDSERRALLGRLAADACVQMLAVTA